VSRQQLFDRKLIEKIGAGQFTELAPATLRCTGKNENGRGVVVTLTGSSDAAPAPTLAEIHKATLHIEVDHETAAAIAIGARARIAIEILRAHQ